MTPKEVSLKETFKKIRNVADGLKWERDATERKKLLATLKQSERPLLRLLQAEGAAALLQFLLRTVGVFHRTTNTDLLFFRDGDHQLYHIEEKTFERYLIQLTDEVLDLRRDWLPRLQAWTRFEAGEVDTHFLAYNDGPDLDVIALNTFDGDMMRRKRGGSWERVPNGTDGVLFLTPPEFLTPWRADSKGRSSGRDLDWLCSLGHFADDGALSPDDQRWLLRVWLLHLFVPVLNPVHPIPLHEGVTGCGKSVLGEAIGRWLTGPRFEVIDLPSGDSTKAEESIKLALCKRPLVVIDNVDSPAPWLEDFLCRYATGVRMSRRRLYTNAEEVHFTPRAGLIVTSRDPHFRREDVARRMLPIRFRPITAGERRTETEIRAEVDGRRNRIWADVLGELARIQDAWPKVKASLSAAHSLADFSIFGALLAETDLKGPRTQMWQGLMARLEQAQGQFTTEEDPLVELLRRVIPPNGILSDRPVRDLYTTLADEAQRGRLPWPYKGVGALTRALKNKRTSLERALNVRIVLDNRHQGGEYRVAIAKVPGTATQDGAGGDSGQGGDGSSISPSAKEPRCSMKCNRKPGAESTMATIATEIMDWDGDVADTWQDTDDGDGLGVAITRAKR